MVLPVGATVVPRQYPLNLTAALVATCMSSQAMTINCPRLRKMHIGAQSSNVTDDAFCKLTPAATSGDGAPEAGELRHMYDIVAVVVVVVGCGCSRRRCPPPPLWWSESAALAATGRGGPTVAHFLGTV
jgi:hypothetical protein